MKLVFCKLYQLFRYLNVDRIPQYSAIGIQAVLLTFNVIVAQKYIEWAQGRSQGYTNLPSVPVIYLFMFGFCYWRFVRNDRFIDLYKKFHLSKINSGPAATLITIGYAVVSVLLLLSLAWLGR